MEPFLSGASASAGVYPSEEVEHEKTSVDESMLGLVERRKSKRKSTMASVLRAQREASAKREKRRAVTRCTLGANVLRRTMQVMTDSSTMNATYSLVPTDDKDADVASNVSDELMHLKSLQWHSTMPPVEEEPQTPTWCKRVLDNWIFQVAMALVVMTNGIVIGMETDLPKLRIWNWVEVVFLVIFASELALRLKVFGFWKYFRSAQADFVWNIIDFTVVAIGLIDLICCIFGIFRDECENPTFRLVRALRILRVFKIVRFLRQLYMLAYGFIAAGKAVFWVTILMVFLLYICSVVLVWTLGPNSAHPSSTQVGAILEERFNTIPGSMLTLFQLMSQPDLMEYYPLFEEYWLLGGFLILFIIFGSFGMIAMLTGVITENMFEKNQLRVDEDRKKKEAQYVTVRSHCLALFDEIDETELNIHGEAPKEVLATLVPRIVEVFETHLVEFTQHDLDGILDLMDVDGTGFIHKDEFCHGILSLAEGIRPMSVMEVMYAVVRNQVEIGECRELLVKMSEELSSLSDRDLEHHSRTSSVEKTLSAQSRGVSEGETLSAHSELKSGNLSECKELLLKVAADVTDVAERQKEEAQERRLPQLEPRSSVAETINMQQSFGKQLHVLSSNMGAMARLQNELLEHSRALSSLSEAILQQVGDVNAGIRRDATATQTYTGAALGPMSITAGGHGDALLDQTTTSGTPSPSSTRVDEFAGSPTGLSMGVHWGASCDPSSWGVRTDALVDSSLQVKGMSHLHSNGGAHSHALPVASTKGLALTSSRPQKLGELFPDGDKKSIARRSPKTVTFHSEVDMEASRSPAASHRTQQIRAQPRPDKVLVDDVTAQMRDMIDARLRLDRREPRES